MIGEHDGREVVLISEQPRMVLIDRFLDQKQCEDLRALAGPLLQRSRVSSGTEVRRFYSTAECLRGQRKGEEKAPSQTPHPSYEVEPSLDNPCIVAPRIIATRPYHEMTQTTSPPRSLHATQTKSRTSSGCFFTGKLESEPAVRSAEDAISRLIESDVLLRDSRGLTVRKRLNKTEALQAVHYAVGQEYKEHYDNRAGSVHLRAATVIVYVGRKCKEGGATHFPKALAVAGRRGVPGVRVYPREGRALVFWSRKEDGSEDHASLVSGRRMATQERWMSMFWEG